jgi:hypothetical protein
MRDFLLTRPLRCDAFVKAHAFHHHSIFALGRMVPARGEVGVCWLIFSVMAVMMGRKSHALATRCIYQGRRCRANL